MTRLQATMTLRKLDHDHVTFSYAHDKHYLASLVISHEIWLALGKPESLTVRMEQT